LLIVSLSNQTLIALSVLTFHAFGVAFSFFQFCF